MACVFGELNDIVASFFSSTIEDLAPPSAGFLLVPCSSTQVVNISKHTVFYLLNTF